MSVVYAHSKFGGRNRRLLSHIVANKTVSNWKAMIDT